MKQLEIVWSDLSPDDLRTLLTLGWAEPSGATPDGRVTEYRLTHAGRYNIARLSKPADDSVPVEFR